MGTKHNLPAPLQKLVMVYENTDGCTFSCTNTIPFLYESPEAALVDIEQLLKEAYFEKGLSEIAFAGQTFYVHHFVEDQVVYPPNIYTLEEWFDKNV